jgi:hypothetical protein
MRKTARWKIRMLVAMVAAACFGVHAARCQEPAAAARSGQSEASLAAGTAVHADLNGGLDSKKAKVGDAVHAYTTEAVKSKDGHVILPNGTKLVGHITQAEARSKGAEESALGIVFDKAILKGGGEVSLNVIIQAMGAPVTLSSSAEMISAPEPSAAGTSQTSPMSGRQATAPSTQAPPGGVNTGAQPAAEAMPSPLGPNSRGVYGLRGLTLRTVPANNVLVSVLTSDGKNVHLDSGTRFLLVVQGSEAPGR